MVEMARCAHHKQLFTQTTDTGAQSKTIWNLQDDTCILSKNSKCSIDFKGFRFHAMETLLCALELVISCDTPKTIQDKWLCEQFTARKFKQGLLYSCGSPLCDPNDPVYSVMMSSRKMVSESIPFIFPLWIESHTRLTRGQAIR